VFYANVLNFIKTENIEEMKGLEQGNFFQFCEAQQVAMDVLKNIKFS
jgi:hypothetical protein